MDLLKKWLDGKRNYHVGAVLYANFGTDAALKKLFAGKPSPHTQKLLEEAILGLLQQPAVILQPAEKNGDADEMQKSADPVLEALRNEWLAPYQKMNYLRHELDRYQDDTPEQKETRARLAREILDLEQQCLQVWNRRAFYLKAGKLPEAPALENQIPEDPLALGKLIESLKRNVRRNKQLAEQHPDKPVYAQKAIQYEQELHGLLKKLNDGKGT